MTKVPLLQEAAEEEEERELSADEMGRKIASQWTTDPDAAGSSETKETSQAAHDQVSPAWP